MSQRKQARLLLLLAALVAALVVARLVLAGSKGAHEPIWMGDPVSGVAQAAATSTDAVQHGGLREQARQMANGDDWPAATAPSPVIALSNSGGSSNVAPAQAAASIDGASGGKGENAHEGDSPAEGDLWCNQPDGSRRLNINRAARQDLDALPGIGPVIAEAILQERARRGRFASLADLLEVKGIGEARHARLAPLLCLPDEPGSR